MTNYTTLSPKYLENNYFDLFNQKEQHLSSKIVNYVKINNFKIPEGYLIKIVTPCFENDWKFLSIFISPDFQSNSITVPIIVRSLYILVEEELIFKFQIIPIDAAYRQIRCK